MIGRFTFTPTILAAAAVALDQPPPAGRSSRVRRLSDDQIRTGAHALGAAIYDRCTEPVRHAPTIEIDRSARAKAKRARRNAKRLRDGGAA